MKYILINKHCKSYSIKCSQTLYPNYMLSITYILFAREYAITNLNFQTLLLNSHQGYLFLVIPNCGTFNNFHSMYMYVQLCMCIGRHTIMGCWSFSFALAGSLDGGTKLIISSVISKSVHITPTMVTRYSSARAMCPGKTPCKKGEALL